MCGACVERREILSCGERHTNVRDVLCWSGERIRMDERVSTRKGERVSVVARA